MIQNVFVMISKIDIGKKQLYPENIIFILLFEECPMPQFNMFCSLLLCHQNSELVFKRYVTVF